MDVAMQNVSAQVSLDALIAQIAELEESLAARRARLCELGRLEPGWQAEPLRRMRIAFAVYEFRSLIEIRDGFAELAASLAGAAIIVRSRRKATAHA